MVKHDLKGLIFNIQRYSVHDGPGARTTVFFKGCPLRCLWCSNPESQNFCPEIAFHKNKCSKCYRCVDACPNKAIYVKNKEDFITINRKLCNNCSGYWCIEECYEGALELIGRYITVEDLLKEVKKDSLLYRNSGGGVTL
ncbi:MAG: 4Fe-4S binding protein, partial [Methanosarcinales archaeon]